MKLLEAARRILYADNFVSKYKADDEHRNQRGIALIAAMAFAVMSVLNIEQRSYAMLATTSGSAVFLLIGYWISRYLDHSAFLRVIFYCIFIIIFTAYTIMGGNDGFAVLWLVIATYAVMIAIDFKAGFVISITYLIMLMLVFIGPWSFVLQYDYNKTFMLRFPFLYGINFAFATYIVIRIRMYQYEILLKQQELEELSTIDLSTGLKNRNYYIKQEQSFSYKNIQMLLAVFIDVNGLHEINNRDGHDAGDVMLCFIADLCKKYFSEHSLYRMGGDEFLILCKNVEEVEIMSGLQKMLHMVGEAGYSISYGIEIQRSSFDLCELVKNADANMIEFKKNYYKDVCRNKR